jgi:hypothetical protein
MIGIRHGAALAAIVFAASILYGCGAVISYDRMQEENDRQALIRDYRECVESHTENPAMCDHITAGLNAASLSVHQSGN